MEALFASGHVADLVLALTALEGAALVAYYRRTGRGVAPGDLVRNLLAGAFLVLALRCALVGAWWGWTAPCLALALLAHLADLRRRWKRRRDVPPNAVRHRAALPEQAEP